MKNLIILICSILLLGTHLPPDDNLYLSELPEVTVTANILEGYTPQRAKTKEEIISLNKQLFQYVAKHTWLTEAQVYGKFRMEQGYGSELFYKHNNPFNIKGNRSDGTVTYRTREVDSNGNDYYIEAKFAKYNSIEDSLLDFIDYINTRFKHEQTTNELAFKFMYNKGYHTDPRYSIRVKFANEYDEIKY